MADVTLDVALIFDDWRDWRDSRQSIYGTAIGLSLSSGDLHSGSTFRATITVDPDTAEELMAALDAGYQPVFRMGKRTVTNTQGVGKIVAVSERPPLVIEDDETCAYCAGYKTEIARLNDILDRIAETTGIAGADRPIDVEECVRSLVQFRAEDNEKAQAEVARLTSLNADLNASNIKLQAYFAEIYSTK